MITRRQAIAGTAAAMAMTTPVLGAKAETITAHDETHPLFSRNYIPGASWRDAPNSMTYSIDPDAVKTAREQGIDLMKEMYAALDRGIISELEVKWLSGLRNSHAPVDTFDFSRYSETFSGDVHNHFVDMLLDHASDDDNTVIVSPTSLVVMQSASQMHDRFVRDSENVLFDSSIKRVGIMNGPTISKPMHRRPVGLKVFCDVYAADNTPSLIGYVAPDPSQRDAAIVKVGETEFLFGTKPSPSLGWKSIGIDTKTLSFL